MTRLPRVLLVDDHDQNIYYLRALFESAGYVVDAARHGAEALVSARRCAPDLVVSDLLMPVMDGYTLLTHWRSEPQFANIPFVVYTATYTEPEDERLALSLGADAFILKPAEPDQFLEKIDEVRARASSGALAAQRKPVPEYAVMLRAYTDTLIRKLGEKTAQLEEANVAMRQDIATRARAEARNAELLQQLGERIKELGALRSAAAILLNHETPIPRLLADIAALVPPAMLHADVAAAHVAYGESAAATPNFRPTPWFVEAVFSTGDGRRGVVQVAYLERRWREDAEPFLKEEGELLTALADMLRSHFERRRAESALRGSEALHRMAGRIARMGAWTVDLPGFAFTWSDEMCAIHGVSGGFQPSLDLALDFYVPEHRTVVQRAFERCASEGAPFDLELEITVEGRRVWVRLIGEAVRDATGAVYRMQGATQDITDKKLAEERERLAADERRKLEAQFLRAQRMESIGTLASGIAHDLNNVLSPIMMSVGLLRDDEHDPERLAMLDSIDGSAQRGADMVRQVLAFARGVEGKHAPVDLVQLVRDVQKILKDTFPKNIDLVVDIAPSIPSVYADVTQLHQLLMNLCVNARDAMPGGGRLTVSAAATTAGGDEAPAVVLRVSDTGTGMPPEVLDRIFEPFFTTKEIGKGTGLGLSTVLTIVRSHGGNITTDSEPGKGTTFHITLPAAPKGTPSESHAAEQHELPRGRGELILVVDDEDGIRNLTKKILERHGYRVLLAANGAEAVAIYAQHRRDIAAVLTDMAMPVMDGPATVTALKALNPDVKVIGCSGHTASDAVARALGQGVQRFIPKPYAADAMLHALDALLGPRS